MNSAATATPWSIGSPTINLTSNHFPSSRKSSRDKSAHRLPAKSSRAGRAVRGDAQRCRQSDSSRHHPLAVAKFLRLLSLQCLRPGNSRRSSLFRPGRARHALVHQSRLHGTGNPRARLARNHAWIAGEIPFLEYRRRSDSRYGIECRTLRAARRSRTCHQLHQQQKRMRRPHRRLRLHANSFFPAEGRDDRRDRRRQSAPD